MKDSAKLLTARNLIRGWLTIWSLYFALDAIESLPTVSSSVIVHVMSVLYVVGTVLTVPAFILFYAGKAKNSKFNPIWIVYTCIIAWGIFLLSLGSGYFNVPFSVVIFLLGISHLVASLLTIPALIVAFLGLIKQRDDKELSRHPVNQPLAQAVAGLTVLALGIGTYAAIHTLGISAENDKFVYNNLANGLGLGAVALIALLSYLQRDIYWLGRGRSLKLDERQLHERQQVFETSYKIGTALVFYALYLLYGYRHSIPTIVRRDSVTPGDMLWPFANLALTLFALPLLVAACKKQP